MLYGNVCFTEKWNNQTIFKQVQLRSLDVNATYINVLLICVAIMNCVTYLSGNYELMSDDATYNICLEFVRVCVWGM